MSELSGGRWSPFQRNPGKRVLPGFALSMGVSLLFISLILLLPVTGLLVQTAGMSWEQYWGVITDERVVASYKVTLWAAGIASLFNGLAGLLLAWVLVRYEFPGKRLIDALIDLPFEEVDDQFLVQAHSFVNVPHPDRKPLTTRTDIHSPNRERGRKGTQWPTIQKCRHAKRRRGQAQH